MRIKFHNIFEFLNTDMKTLRQKKMVMFMQCPEYGCYGSMSCGNRYSFRWSKQVPLISLKTMKRLDHKCTKINWLTKNTKFLVESTTKNEVLSHTTSSQQATLQQHSSSSQSPHLNLHQHQVPADAVDLVYDLRQAPHTSSCTAKTAKCHT